VVSGSDDNTVRVWDLQTGKQLQLLQGHTGLVSSVALQGNTVVSGSWDDTVRVWDLQTGKQLQLLQGHTDWVRSVALQGNTVVSGSDDKTVRVWNLLLQGHTESVRSVALQGNTVVSIDCLGEERVWQPECVGARQEETMAVNGGFHVEGSRVRRDGCDVGFTFDNVRCWSGGDNGFAAIGKHFAAFLLQQPA
jgi:predicted NACHT family NTPase